jgi:Na+/proline symporter
MLVATLLATAIPLAVYLYFGFRKDSKAETIDDYFIYSQKVTTADYANTSVGYALQMAAVFLFAYWGVLYGLGALWTPLFWALGFWLLLRLIPKFIPYHKYKVTMHEYLAQKFQAGRRLQIAAAVATIVGLWGTMMAEIDYTIQIYSPVIKSQKGIFLLGSALLIFGMVYILKNGYKAEVNTERLQLPVTYAGFIAVLVLSLPRIWLHAGTKAYWITWGLFLTTLLIMLVGKLLVGWRSALKDPQVLIPVLGLMGLFLIEYFISARALSPGHEPSVFDQPLRTQMNAQGAFALFSLFLANFFWMPVDLSTWQRISSVNGGGAELSASLKRGTQRVLFESPATWLLGVILGLTISGGGYLKTGADASEGLISYSAALASGAGFPFVSNSLPTLLYFVFLIACLSIMLSTVHGILCAITFTAYKDLPPYNKTGTKAARAWTIALILAGMIFYPLLRLHMGANLPTILYGAYSAQLCLIVVALVALYDKRLEKRAAFWSIMFGFAGTIISVILAINVTDPDAAVLPPIFAIFSALAGYVIMFKRTRSAKTDTVA